MMKNLFFSTLLFLIMAPVYSQNGALPEKVEVRLDRMTMEDKIKQLGVIHQKLFQLPHDEDFIKLHIINELLEFSSLNAPNFPGFSGTQEDHQMTPGIFEDWITFYPEEYKVYFGKAYELIRKYQVKNITE